MTADALQAARTAFLPPGVLPGCTPNAEACAQSGLVTIDDIPLGPGPHAVARRVHVAYLPDRLVLETRDVVAAVQRCAALESVTDAIARHLAALLRPRGLRVLIEAHCDVTDGAQPAATTVTIKRLGALRDWPPTGVRMGRRRRRETLSIAIGEHARIAS